MSDIGEYEAFDSNDPNGVAKHDQLHAEAVETLRNSKSFALFTTDNDTDETLRMRAGFKPGVDRSDYLEGMSRLVWRIYFERCLALTGKVTIADMSDAIDNFSVAGLIVLHEMRDDA